MILEKRYDFFSYHLLYPTELKSISRPAKSVETFPANIYFENTLKIICICKSLILYLLQIRIKNIYNIHNIKSLTKG